MTMGKIFVAVLTAKRADAPISAATIYGVHDSIQDAAHSFYERGKKYYSDARVEVLWESIHAIDDQTIIEAGWLRKPHD